MNFFDTHSHYDDKQFDTDRKIILNKIYEDGVTRCIDVGTNIETSKISIELSKKYSFMYSACGIHPNELPKNMDEIDIEISQIKKIVLENRKIVAIGEIGLDYHYEDSPTKDIQQYAFLKQIELANQLKLPISIHTRDAIDDTISIIRKTEITKGGNLHCCPFNRELVKHGLEKGLYIGFGGTTTFKNAKNAAEIIKMVPDNKILIETDCPYLSPEPLRGTRNNSSNLKYVVQKLAEIRGCQPEYIAQITYENANRLFGLN